jgi:hypothetical protein
MLQKDGKSAWNVTEYLPNTAEKWEISMECDRTSVKHYRKMGISMECDRTSVKYWRKFVISMECDRKSSKYCRKWKNPHGM